MSLFPESMSFSAESEEVSGSINTSGSTSGWLLETSGPRSGAERCSGSRCSKGSYPDGPHRRLSVSRQVSADLDPE